MGSSFLLVCFFKEILEEFISDVDIGEYQELGHVGSITSNTYTCISKNSAPHLFKNKKTTKSWPEKK